MGAFLRGEKPFTLLQPAAFAVKTGVQNQLHLRHALRQLVQFRNLLPGHLAPAKRGRRSGWKPVQECACLAHRKAGVTSQQNDADPAQDTGIVQPPL
jgi:hypothetical protein